LEDFLVAKKPTYEELEQRVQELERADFDRKQAQEALRESEERYRTLVEAGSRSGQAIVLVRDTDQVEAACVFANDAASDITGYGQDELAQMSWLDIVHPLERDSTKDRYKARMRGEDISDVFEISIIKKGGTEIPIELASIITEFQGKKVLVVLFRDIRDRKQAEEELRKSEERLKTLTSTTPAYIYELDTNGVIAFVNRTYEDVTKNQVVGSRLIDWFPEDQHATIDSLIEKAFSTEEPQKTVYTIPDPKGVLRSYVAEITPFRREGGIKNAVLTATEITDLKQAEEDLRIREQAIESSINGINFTDSHGRFIYANRSFLKMWGFKTQDDLIGRSIPELWADQEKFHQAFDGFHKHGFYVGELEGKRQDGTTFSAQLSASVVKNEKDEAISLMASFIDVTERNRLQAQLQRAHKMEAIGTLAGGVAHDLNNILGGLVSYPELLLLQLPEDSPLRKSILTIQKSGEKAAAVVQDLLTLARRGVVVTEVVNLHDVIADYLKSPEHENLQSYHPGVHIETHLDKDALNILGSPTHLSKTVMNLVSNAAEAMPEGGKLTVSTKGRYIDKLIREITIRFIF